MQVKGLECITFKAYHDCTMHQMFDGKESNV
jgi:hypothetical protein